MLANATLGLVTTPLSSSTAHAQYCKVWLMVHTGYYSNIIMHAHMDLQLTFDSKL